MKTFLLLSLLSLFSLPALAQSTPPPEVGVAQLERAGLAAPIVTLAAGEVIPAEVPAAPSAFSAFVGQFVTPTNIAAIIVSILSLVFGALHLEARRKEQVAIVTKHAFNFVEDYAATTENVIDDKVAIGLRAANEYMVANGWRRLKPDEEARAKLGFTALNGETKIAEKIADAAATSVNLLPPGSTVPPSP